MPARRTTVTQAVRRPAPRAGIKSRRAGTSRATKAIATLPGERAAGAVLGVPALIAISLWHASQRVTFGPGGPPARRQPAGAGAFGPLGSAGRDARWRVLVAAKGNAELAFAPRRRCHESLVAYATRHGATAGIAERIAAALTAAGVSAEARAVEDVKNVEPYDAVVFGAYDPDAPAVGLGERFVQHMPAARAALPAGDFRDWPAIDAWAAQIAAELGTGELRGD